MANVNMTKVYLLNVPLESNYDHTLYFTSKETQQSYFQSRAVESYTDFTYQRKDNLIRIPEQFDRVLGANYVMYQNLAYSNKWFYAFIKDVRYINDGLTEVEIETDVIQTWMFEYEVKASFVEREHVDDDTVGLHTVPEQLETGEYTCNNAVKCKHLLFKSIVLGVTVDLNDTDFDGIAGAMYAGVYSGVRYYVVDELDLEVILPRLASAGKSDAIVCMFMGPTHYISVGTNSGYKTVASGATQVEHSWDAGILGIEEEPILKPDNLDAWFPRNKKLLTYPYCYLLVDNNSGSSAVYHYELFNRLYPSRQECNFKIVGTVTPGFSMRLIPQDYNGASGDNNLEGLNGGKFPICNWNTDVYTNWLTQNGVNIATNIVGGALQGVAGGLMMAGTGGVGAIFGGGSVVGGLTQIASTVGEVYAHSLQPPQAEGNINSGDVTYASGHLTFTAYQMSIKLEYARIIDGYFDMYGYKVNQVKVPNKAHRGRWWFTKLINPNIDGAIPNKDMQLIKDCYSRGITFWRNAEEIQNYNLDNNIV